jgi:hypothetical protein
MFHQVFANDNEIAARSDLNKVIANFPDVCLSPPSPPAGPIPVPYPDTSFSKDLQKGSKNVKIKNEPAALAQQSYYKSSPLGDEAATRSFGANVITHQITGKTYFQAWSFTVEFEGKGVCRHMDICTSNHMSQTGGVPAPAPGQSQGGTGGGGTDECGCCHGPMHSAAQKKGESMTGDQWYNPNYASNPPPWYDPSKCPKGQTPAPTKREQMWIDMAQAVMQEAKDKGCHSSLPPNDPSNPCAAHYVTEIEEKKKNEKDYETMMETIDPANTKAQLVLQYGEKLGEEVFARGERLNKAISPGSGATSIAHKTAKAAGGCPIGEGNLEPVSDDCADIENKMSTVQNGLAQYHRRVNGLRYAKV